MIGPGPGVEDLSHRAGNDLAKEDSEVSGDGSEANGKARKRAVRRMGRILEAEVNAKGSCAMGCTGGQGKSAGIYRSPGCLDRTTQFHGGDPEVRQLLVNRAQGPDSQIGGNPPAQLDSAAKPKPL